MAEPLGHDITLLKKIGSGGMAEVFLARKRFPDGSEKTIAVKRILPHLAIDKNLLAQFEREIQLLSKMYHPNIVTVYGSGQTNGFFFLTMEYIEGKNLTDIQKQLLLSGNSLPIHLACDIVLEIAKGVSYAHQLEGVGGEGKGGLIHRDLNPLNIMLTSTGGVKVLDFGLAKALNSTRLTRTGCFKGTPCYASPEQVRNEPLDQRTDIFSLGIILFELITGQELFAGSTAFEVFKKVVDSDAPKLREIRPDAPKGLEDILATALANNCDDRYPQMEDFSKALKKFSSSRQADMPDEKFKTLVSEITNLTPGVPSPLLPRRELTSEQDGGPSNSTSRRTATRAATSFTILFLLAALLTFAFQSSSTPSSASSMRKNKSSNGAIPGLLYSFHGEGLVADRTGKISLWRSGDGFTVAQQLSPKKQPLIGEDSTGSQFARFNGQSQYLTLDGIAPTLASLSSCTIAIIARLDSGNTLEKRALFSTNTETNSAPIFFIGLGSDGRAVLRSDSKEWRYLYSTNTFLPMDQFSLFVAQYEKSGGRLLVNGKVVLDGTKQGRVRFESIKRVSIGQEWGRGGESDLLKGDIAAIEIYDHSLNANELASLLLSAKEKYSIHPGSFSN